MNMYHFKRAVISGLLRPTLDAPPLVGTYADDSFGISVDFNDRGDICVIGSPGYSLTDTGSVEIYKQNSSTLLWEQLGSSIVGGADERIGYSVSITDDGYRIIIGSEGSNSLNGSIYVYDYDYSTSDWVLSSTLTGEGVGAWSGFSVAVNSTGNTIAFGSPKDDAIGEDRGSVVVYRQRFGVWSKIGTFYGELVGDNSGWAISLNSDGNIIAIGAPFNDSSGVERGHVRVFQYTSGTSWIQLGADIDGTPNSQTGFSVSLNNKGDLVAVGNILDSTYSTNSGVVKVYSFVSMSWVQYGDTIIGNPADLTGYSVSFNNTGNELSVSYPYKDSGSKIDTGAVDVYSFKNSVWKKIYPRIPGITAQENSGWSTSLSKNSKKIIIGAPNYTESGNKIGIARIYTLPRPFTFWDFNYTSTKTLSSFRVNTSVPSTIDIRWGDGTSDTVSSGSSINHTYTI